MITPILEKYLITGQAKLKVHTHAITAVSKIPVPGNKFIIITNILAYPCSNVKAVENQADSPSVDKVNTYTIDFFSGNEERKTFFIRNAPTLNLDKSNLSYITNSPPISIDTFMVYSQNVYIGLLTPPMIVSALSIDFAPLVNSQLMKIPVSYGNTVDVTRSYIDASGAQYIPTSIEEAGATNNGLSSNQPTTLINDDTSKLANPNTVNQNNLFPLITIQYVILNEQIRQELT